MNPGTPYNNPSSMLAHGIPNQAPVRHNMVQEPYTNNSETAYYQSHPPPAPHPPHPTYNPTPPAHDPPPLSTGPPSGSYYGYDGYYNQTGSQVPQDPYQGHINSNNHTQTHWPQALPQAPDNGVNNPIHNQVHPQTRLQPDCGPPMPLPQGPPHQQNTVNNWSGGYYAHHGQGHQQPAYNNVMNASMPYNNSTPTPNHGPHGQVPMRRDLGHEAPYSDGRNNMYYPPQNESMYGQPPQPQPQPQLQQAPPPQTDVVNGNYYNYDPYYNQMDRNPQETAYQSHYNSNQLQGDWNQSQQTGHLVGNSNSGPVQPPMRYYSDFRDPVSMPQTVNQHPGQIRSQGAQNPSTSPNTTAKTRRKRPYMSEEHKQSGYAKFYQKKRKELKLADFGQASKVISELWNNLTPDEKSVYAQKVSIKRKEMLKKKASQQAQNLLFHSITQGQEPEMIQDSKKG